MSKSNCTHKRTGQLLDAIALYYEADTIEIIKALIGIAWSEEEAGDIISSLDQ